MWPTTLAKLISNPAFIHYLNVESDRSQDKAGRDGIATMVNVAEHLKEEEIKTYVVSDALLEVMKDVDCGEVTSWHLSGVRAYHFSFKKGSIKDSTTNYKELFVTIIPQGRG